MNKVININFQGRVLPIEEHAYEILKQYIESLRKYFSKEEGCDEIINDIECRIAELCDERLKKGEVCITDATINLIIASIGRPEDFDAQEEHFENQSSTSQSSDSYTHSTSGNEHKRLYRDAKNKVFGGVCAGRCFSKLLAAVFGGGSQQLYLCGLGRLDSPTPKTLEPTRNHCPSGMAVCGYGVGGGFR